MQRSEIGRAKTFLMYLSAYGLLWQYVDLMMDARSGLDAAAVLDFLPVAGHRGPTSMAYGLTWRDDSHMRPRPDTRIVLTVAGLRHLPEAGPLLAAFLTTFRFLVEEQRMLVPDPFKVVEANVASEAVAERLRAAGIVSGERQLQVALRKVGR